MIAAAAMNPSHAVRAVMKPPALKMMTIIL
jgi:hypothetical protein